MIEGVLRRIARAQSRRPWGILVLLVGLTASALLLLPRFRVETDVASLFPAGDAAVELLRATETSSRSARTMFLRVQGTNLEERLPALLESLEASPHLTEVAGTKQAFGGELVRRARSAPIWFLPENVCSNLEKSLSEEGIRAALEESRRMLAEDPALAREVVLRDPLGLRWILEAAAHSSMAGRFDPESPFLLFEDGEEALVQVIGHEPSFEIDFSTNLLTDLEERSAGFDVSYVGAYEIARSDSQRIRSDMISSIAISVPLLLLFLSFSTRSLFLPAALCFPIGLSVLWSLAWGGALLGPLTPLAVGSAAILMGIGFDFAIHYGERYLHERQMHEHATAVEVAHTGTGRALFFGMATSVLAFLSIGLASFGNLGSFGLLLALGLVAAWGATLLLLPLLLSPFARRQRDTRGGVWQRLAHLSESGHGRALAITLALLALAAWGWVGWKGLRFDADPMHLRPEGEGVEEKLGALGERLGFSPIGSLVLCPMDTPIEDLSRSARTLQDRGVVAYSSGAHRTVPTPERRERVRLFRERTDGWVERARQGMVAAGFQPSVFEDSLEEWRLRFEADPPPVPDQDVVEWDGRRWWKLSLFPARLSEGAAQRRAWREQVRAGFPDSAEVVDAGLLADRLGPRIERDLARSAWISALAVGILLLAATRNLRDALVAMVPVLCGVGASLAAAVLAGWPLHLGNFIAVPLVLGLGVDDGIHMVLRQREGRGHAVATTGKAIWRTSVTTCLGFGSLVSAKSPALASLGTLVLIGIVAAFLASILLVPVLWKGRES